MTSLEEAIAYAENALSKAAKPKTPEGGPVQPGLGTMISVSPYQLRLLVDAAQRDALQAVPHV